MQKRLTILILILVFIKPAYDGAMIVKNQVTGLIETNEIAESIKSIAVSKGKGSEGEETVEKTSSKVATSQETVQLPKKVQSLEELADAFFYYFSKWETDFVIQYKGSTSDMENLINQAVDLASNRDQYILGHLGDREIEYEYNKFNAKIKVQQEYLTNAAQEQYVNKRVKRILENEDIHAMSDFEKVKFVNDFIVKNTEYSTNTTLSPHSACAVLQENKGVCQGYALLALKMLRELGIETMYVVGKANAEDHAWNLVKLDNEWYHLDVTWNDPVPDRGNVVRYQYFLIDDSKMKLDHQWDQAKYPKATSKKYAFMTQIDHAYEKDGYIYYSNMEDDYRLYRINVSTGENMRLTKSRAQYIVGYGDWIYFSNYSNGAYLTKIRTDGLEESIIYREEVSNLFIEDGYLIFSTDEGVKRIEI